MSPTPAGVFTKNDYAYEQLRTRILSGQLEAGAVIPQGPLAKELGLSTTPLREAIRRLAAEQMVVLEAHRDARVSMVTADEARHLYEVRESADPLAARLAAQRRTASDVALIEQALERLRPIRQADDLEALMIHREFHRAIYRSSGNPILIDVLERLWDKADRYRVVGLRDRADSPSDVDRVAAEHAAIAQAVVDGDPAAADSAMRSHVEHSLGRRAVTALEKAHDGD